MCLELLVGLVDDLELRLLPNCSLTTLTSIAYMQGRHMFHQSLHVILASNLIASAASLQCS